ncbi:TfuA-like protein [Kitasatospora sp. NPDC048239]|uniref:TfuA-like protein n=1 Tax=Kitasatospora sp. NPDC048239 TaxID=3364046 RepID=UPI003717181D
MITHVFTGPTLAPDEPVLAAPSVCCHPPARHGDLFRAEIAPGDTVVLIDGLYHHAPALRHKEILAALGRGVHVIGAASIGALRAAELGSYGVLGVGRIFGWYAAGVLAGDDEVAVAHMADGTRRSLTWPLVNLRHVMVFARAEGVVTVQQATALLEACAGVYYAQRTFDAVQAAARSVGVPAFGPWLGGRRRADRFFGDLKRTDAVEAVRAALTRGARADTRPARADWDSPYYRCWTERFAPGRARVAARVAYQQIFDPAFPTVWAAYLDRVCRLHGGRPSADQAVRLGLPASLPLHLVIRPRIDLADEAGLAVLLARESADDRAAVGRYLAANRLAAPHFTPEAVTDAAARGVLLRLWNTTPDDLPAECAARGLRGHDHAIGEMKTFMLGFLQERRTFAAAARAGGAR